MILLCKKILSPICKDQKEKSALEKNAAKLVRQCATDVGKKMSWSQAWERFKDRVSDIVGSLIRSDNSIKKIITQHPKLKRTLQSNLKNTDTTTKTIIPKSKPRDSISR